MGGNHLGDPGIDGKSIRINYRKRFCGCGLYLTGSGLHSVGSYYKHGNKHLGSVKGGEILEQIGDYQFLNKDFITFS
jgi:hypothetical protein